MASVELIQDTFLGVEMPPYDECSVVIVRAPYDATTSYVAGARHGPAAIIEASQQLELWDMDLERRPSDVGIHTMATLLPSAAGPQQMCDQIAEVCSEGFQGGKLVVTLGGDHSVTIGAARACRQAAAQDQDLSFLLIDAHLDLRDSYEGTKLSHACVGRRLLELGTVTHVGARVACEEELAVIADRGLQPIWAREIVGATTTAWIDRVLEQLGDRVYVTVDVDGLDPSVIPATGTPVPGGLAWYDLAELLAAVGERRQVVGCDLVELAPVGADAHRSAFAAAMLVHKMIGLFAGR